MGESQDCHQVTPLLTKWVRLKPEARLYQMPYPVVALTGGIASGKSTLGQFLKSKGVAFLSADQLIKDIYSWPLTKIWLSALAPDVLENGEVLFHKLREKVFQNPELKTEVENFLYARLPQAFQQRAQEFKNVGWMVYEIPLLYERQMESLFDVSIVSWVPREIQKQRLMSRDPLTTSATAEAILAAQMSLDEKKKKADIVFENIYPPGKEMDTELATIWKKLTEK